ncbi:hypothetical protein TPAU25S_01293 [Tsukamurella paurometabola]|uniref:DUF4440 domain-containing protein n=1 Tax=Tsukamurella paurometabola (strain ATCC 8368 / DSM 20162 / CCUG 35730 / CIP 100753 / JCM 10117 / KCTC 9821 / NBRC 16120 / NCIMB 702349 / NCTC 13040) TaxID=521096 RepID=D5UUJ6_TSUPD|nr:DUF4440 domain-containing protein [Tsukamurella paurometabola]ADG77567.1 conserved hypothetical protein [Tsukamurella paurometabola DSM 20162]SUP27743.1 Uncharacterized protein conserved in bacteria [Tsukamurella paurometabola]
MSAPEPQDIEREPDRSTARELREVLEDLRRREPIFHRREWGVTHEDFLALTAPDFWEVGASGRRYSRDYVWSALERRYAQDADDPWETSDFQVRATGSSTYLLTYTLTQGDRVTRRLSVWKRRENRWSVLFHQGTPVAAE